MAQFRDIAGNFIFLGVMILAGISFIIITQSNNDVAQPVIQDPLLSDSFNELNATLSDLEDTGGTQYDQFTQEAPEAGFGAIVLFGIVSAGKTFGNVTLGLFQLVIKLPLIILGLPQTLFSAMITWLVISLIIASWVLYKLGG